MMTSTRVVHVNSQEWRDTPEESRVYIGRAMPRQGFKASKWGNPHRVIARLAYPNISGLTPGRSAEEAVWLYESRLATHHPELVAALPELRGKVLGCWCKKRGDEPCHGDVLARLADAL